MEDLIERKAKELVQGASEPPKLNTKVDETKSYGEQAKEYVDVLATKNAILDEQLGDKLTEKKKQELETNADTNLKKEKAKAKMAEAEVQSAEFESYGGVATYAGIKKPLPNKMQKILFTALAFVQMILLLIVSIPTSIVNIMADAVNSVIVKLSQIAKSARILVLTLIGTGLVCALVYIVIEILQKYNVIG